MATGSIVRLIRDRGFGFIRTDNGQEVFFHATGVTAGNYDALQEGQQVTFDKEHDTRTRTSERAVNVQG